MNSRDVEELGWDEQELCVVFTAFVRRHRRMPSRTELELYRWERVGDVAV